MSTLPRRLLEASLFARPLAALALAAAVGCAPRAAVAPAPTPSAAVAAPSAGSACVARQGLVEELRRQWDRERLAPVADCELATAADVLIDYHLANGFYGDRLAGMRRVTGLGPGGELEVALTPQRQKIAAARSDPGSDCVLCNPPFDTERGLAWREWRVWPNAFPYVPASDQHLLMAAAQHLPQSAADWILRDMLDFQLATAGGRQLTLHYNGTAGNSQFHLHWQATRVVLPLQRALDEGRLPVETLRSEPQGRVAAYDQGPYAAFLIEGQRPFVVRWGMELVRRVERDPRVKGHYNFLALQPVAGRSRLVLIPRRADALKPALGSLGERPLGSFNLGGVFVLAGSEVPADLGEALPPAMRATVVPPAEFEWVRRLGSE